MSAIDPIQWCEERLLVPGNPLAVSLLFVGPEQRAKILSLRAIITEIGANAQLHDEPGLAQAKLGWWREALVERRAHPAIQAWVNSGGDCSAAVTGLLGLIEAVQNGLEQARYETVDQAWSMCVSLGGQASAVEFEMLCQDQVPDSQRNALITLGAFGYWVRCVRDLALDARQGRWFVPLELQADYQVSRQDVISGVNQRRWAALVQSMMSIGLQKSNDGVSALQQQAAARHLLLAHALDRRLAKQLIKSPKRMLTHRILPSHWGNVWVAWRSARLLSAG